MTYLYNWHDATPWLMRAEIVPAGRLFEHLWSLSVEEQFYLVFPLVVWLLPPRQLRWLLWLLVLTTPLVRAVAGEVGRTSPTAMSAKALFLNRATVFYLDALAAGGLLALGTGQALARPGRWLIIALLVGAVLNVLGQAAAREWLGQSWQSWRWLGYEHPMRLYRALGAGPLWLRLRWAGIPVLVNVHAGLLLLWAARGGRAAARWLGNRVVRYVGRISYGIYIWHMPLTLLVMQPDAWHWIKGSWLRETGAFVGWLALTLAVASLSYYGFEKKFLRLKERKSLIAA